MSNENRNRICSGDDIDTTVGTRNNAAVSYIPLPQSSSGSDPPLDRILATNGVDVSIQRRDDPCQVVDAHQLGTVIGS